jgi:hypothetical protein
MKAQLLARLGSEGGTLPIVGRLLLDVWVLVPLLVLAVLWRPVLRVPAASAAVLAALAYAAVLFLVYLGTPHDLDWHLRTSVDRVRMPVTLLLGFAVLLALEHRAAGRCRGDAEAQRAVASCCGASQPYAAVALECAHSSRVGL